MKIIKAMVLAILVFVFLWFVVEEYQSQILQNSLSITSRYNNGYTTVMNKRFDFSLQVKDKCVVDTMYLNSMVANRWLGELVCKDHGSIRIGVDSINEKQRSSYRLSMTLLDDSKGALVSIQDVRGDKVFELFFHSNSHDLVSDVYESIELDI